ncbi:MAG: hypothetical protein M1837_003999 [Sclerophora amabilis]|nr:MAG: hypothetical protein M1837_003999 [Sclerophora amabilis]
MPKKYYNSQFSKPASSTHPSLSNRSPGSISSSPNAPQISSSTSVNGILSGLRSSHSLAPGDVARRPLTIGNTSTVHPSLKAMLQVVETPQPRPRPGMRPNRGPVRAPAGPPPPSSWLSASNHAPAHLRRKDRPQDRERLRPSRIDRLPGLEMPKRPSLLDLTLRHLAENWNFHVQYDQHYLASLPARMKSILLAYIALDGPEEGIEVAGLKTLFQSADEVPGATAGEDMTHLDLSGALGSSLSIKQLDRFLSSAGAATKSSPDQHRDLASDIGRSQPVGDSFGSKPAPQEEQLEESWETQADALFSLLTSPTSTTRFPCLTHLSLSHPNPSVSWARLLAFAPHLATLTHLSLAYWPVPCLTPNSKTATISSPYSGSIPYGASDFYSEYDCDWTEAAGILERLSRATYCLKWLDIEGCGKWIDALEWANPANDDVQTEGADWTGAWRGIETVVVSQGVGSENLMARGNERKPVNRYRSRGDDEEDQERGCEEWRRASRATVFGTQWLRQISETQTVCRRIHRKRKGAGLPRIFFDFGNDPCVDSQSGLKIIDGPRRL